MKNKDLIIKTARRLDKFNLDDIIQVTSIDEQEVTDILSELLKEKTLVKNQKTYYFNIQKNLGKEEVQTRNTIKPIVIEEEDGYDYFLTFNENVQSKIRRYVKLLNIVNQTNAKNIKQIIDLFNSTSNEPAVPFSTFTRVLSKFKQSGFEGILPKYTKAVQNYIPEEIYTYFKKYYFTKEKLSAKEALYRAQKHLQAVHKIEQPCAYNEKSFLRKIKTEFTKEQVEYLRNNLETPKTKVPTIRVDEPLDMKFETAAYVYLKNLKMEKKLENLMHDKTNYTNHLKPYFDNLTIREITTKIVAQFKQNMFDNGYKLVSVNIYIALLKRIIRSVCPQTNNLITRNGDGENAYSIDMNILSDTEIVHLLNTCKKKYTPAYPVIYISLSTGASIPEILGLTWDRINFDDNTIFLKYFLFEEHLVMNKCGATIRTLKIDDMIASILKKKFEKTKPKLTDFVFTFKSPRLPQQYIENAVLRGLSAELGIVRLRPSDLQHNFVNMCLKQNVPLTFIQKSLGYYGITNFVKVYRHLIEKSEQDYCNPLEKILCKTK